MGRFTSAGTSGAVLRPKGLLPCPQDLYQPGWRAVGIWSAMCLEALKPK